MLTNRRKTLHSSTIQHITDRAYHYYHAPPHPSELIAADAELKRGIDDDWKASVQRYPEVLEYFYGLVDLSLPGEEEDGVRDPPLSALGGGKRGVRVRSTGRGDGRDGRDGGRRRRRAVVDVQSGREREGRRPGVQFAPMPGAPMPGYSYVQPQY
jgi:hypothetical protein